MTQRAKSHSRLANVLRALNIMRICGAFFRSRNARVPVDDVPPLGTGGGDRQAGECDDSEIIVT